MRYAGMESFKGYVGDSGMPEGEKFFVCLSVVHVKCGGKICPFPPWFAKNWGSVALLEPTVPSSLL